tara:strand:- start:2 stop:529 length:528 start_codon:yes stop_codon:yes gene_type:complete
MTSTIKVQNIKHTNDTTAMTINSNGIVIPKGVIMQVEASDIDQNVGSSDTKIQWESVLVDTISGWDTSNHRYQPNIAGYYLVGGSVRLLVSGINKYFNIAIKRNGSNDAANVLDSQFQFDDDRINNGVYPAATGMMLLNGTSDYVEMWIQGDEAMVAHDSPSQKSHFFAQLVHAT